MKWSSFKPQHNLKLWLSLIKPNQQLTVDLELLFPPSDLNFQWTQVGQGSPNPKMSEPNPSLTQVALVAAAFKVLLFPA